MFNTERTLPPLQQKIGRKRYLWFTRINAFSFGCLAESILILYALKNGADDFVIGLLTSFFFLTMPFMFLGKQIVGKKGAAYTYAISWALRNISATLMIAVPFVIRTIGSTIGLGLLAFSAFGFFSFRSMGFTANTPIIGEITDKSNRGRFISQIWLHFNIFYLITMSALIVILGRSEEIHTFQTIITFGCITGLISSSLIYHVPETHSPLISGQQPIGDSLSFIWKNPCLRKLLFAWTSTLVIIMLINPFSMVALKNGYMVSDHNALFFSLVQIFGGIVVAFINSIILDRVGPRPMLILFSVGLLSVSLLWGLAPGSLIVYYPAFIFFLIGICRAGAMTALSHYFLTVVPDKERVGVNMFMYIISGSFAGLAGTFLGGGLLKILRILGLTNLNIYRTYFLIILFVLLPLLFIIRQMERVADWRIKDVLSIFLSFRDMRALFSLHRLEKDFKRI